MHQITPIMSKQTGTFLCCKISLYLSKLSNSYFQKSYHLKSHLIRMALMEIFWEIKDYEQQIRTVNSPFFTVYNIIKFYLHNLGLDAWSPAVSRTLPYNYIKPQCTEYGSSHTSVYSMIALIMTLRILIFSSFIYFWSIFSSFSTIVRIRKSAFSPPIYSV